MRYCLQVSVSACTSCGMPEARIILGQTAVYLATSAKSNSTYLAINKALELAEKQQIYLCLYI